MALPPPPPQMQLRFTLRTGCGGGLCTPHHGAGTRRATPHQVTMPPSHCAAASPHQNHTATQAASVAPRRTKLHRQALLGLSAVPRYCGGAARLRHSSAVLGKMHDDRPSLNGVRTIMHLAKYETRLAQPVRHGAAMVRLHRARRHQAAL